MEEGYTQYLWSEYAKLNPCSHNEIINKMFSLDISRPLVTSLGFKVIYIVRNSIRGFTGTLENNELYQWKLDGAHEEHPELNLVYADEIK
jgi:hypothetical protein